MANRYAGPTGTGTACSQTSRCSVATALSQAQAGDVILLQSGTLANPLRYTGASYMLAVSGKSGTSSAPITIKAEVDGGVLIDGEYTRTPFSIVNGAWVVVEGINFRHAPNAVAFVDGIQNFTMRRCIAWDRSADINAHSATSPVALVTSGARNILFEDCAFFGVGRKTFSHSQNNSGGTDNSVELRRCWIRYEGYPTGGGAATIRYNSFGTKYVDCLITYDAISVTPGSGQLGIGILTDSWTSSDSKCSGARIHGTLIYLTASQTMPLSNSYALNRLGAAGSSSAEAADIDCIHVRHSAAVVSPLHAFTGRAWFFSTLGTADSNKIVSNVLSVAQTSPEQGSTWTITGLTHSTSIPSVGHATHPWTQTGSTGANLCYRYGTTTPKWPWPMNDRIKAATGYAGRYSGPCTSGCVRGLRAAYDVTADVQSLLGTLPAACKSTSPAPPPPPTTTLSVSPTSLDFDVIEAGSSVSKTVSVANTSPGSGAMAWTATDDESFISVSPASSADAGTLTVTVDPTSLTAGIAYDGVVTVTATGASGSPKQIPVTVTVAEAPDEPTLVLSQPEFTFRGLTDLSLPTQALTIDNDEGSAIAWAAVKGQSWLTLSASSGTTPATITLTVDTTDLDAGTYTDSIVVTSAVVDNSPQVAGVTLIVDPTAGTNLTPVLDAFTRDDNATTLGDDWTVAFGGGGKIVSNAAKTIDTDGTFTRVIWADRYKVDQAPFLDIATLPGVSGRVVILYARYLDESNTGYLLRIEFGSTHVWRIQKHVNGSITTIGASFTQAVTAGDQIALSCVGPVLTALRNGSQVAQRFDSTIDRTGQAGWGARGDSTLVIDDWGIQGEPEAEAEPEPEPPPDPEPDPEPPPEPEPPPPDPEPPPPEPEPEPDPEPTPGTALVVTPTSTVNLTGTSGGPATSAAFTVSSDGELSWSVASDSAWLTASPTGGAGATSYAGTLFANPGALAAATYTGTLTFTAATADSPKTITVSFVVSAAEPPVVTNPGGNTPPGRNKKPRRLRIKNG